MKQLTLNKEGMSLQQALKEIYFYIGVVPVKAYEVLTKHQQEAIPYLLQFLKNAIQRHETTGDYYVAHIHTLLLLSQFREKQAYPLVIELLNLPYDSIDKLIGDMLTWSIPKIVASVYDGNPEPLFALLINHEANEVLRLIIGGCFSALILQQLIDKEMVLLRMQELVASGTKNEDQAFFSSLADMTIECKFEPLYDTIRAAFKADMVLSDYTDIHFFEKSILLPIEQIAGAQDLKPLTDAAQELSKWYSKDNPISPQIERNAPCPCGSGQKFKKCCIHLL
jgi:hypothetical protein